MWEWEFTVLLIFVFFSASVLFCVLFYFVDSDNVIPRNMTPEVQQALRAVRFIAQHIKDADKDNEVGGK